MRTALMWAERSMCSLPDRKIGAVITTPDLRRILSFGYNGPGKGLPNNFCETYRKHEDVGFGSSRCPCLHAEDNAIAGVDSTIPNKTLFVTMAPCVICAQRIANANIDRVFYLKSYRDEQGLMILVSCGIEFHQMNVDSVLSRERLLVEGLFEKLQGLISQDNAQQALSVLNVYSGEQRLL